MAIGTAWRIWEMRFPVSVAAEAHFARESGSLLAVSGVTARAVLVLTHLVEPEQARCLVAAGAGGRCRDPLGAMRSVTLVAAARALPVFRARFLDMAAGAGDDPGSAAVRLVALHTVGVAARSAVRFLLMAALTGCLSRAVMGFVTASALLMPDPGLVRLLGVARLAARQERAGFVRQPAMTARAVAVAAARRDAGELSCMAVTAHRALSFGQRESVRLVTLRAGQAAVKLFVGVRGLVAAAAAAR